MGFQLLAGSEVTIVASKSSGRKFWCIVIVQSEGQAVCAGAVCGQVVEPLKLIPTKEWVCSETYTLLHTLYCEVALVMTYIPVWIEQGRLVLRVDHRLLENGKVWTHEACVYRENACTVPKCGVCCSPVWHDIQDWLLYQGMVLLCSLVPWPFTPAFALVLQVTDAGVGRPGRKATYCANPFFTHAFKKPEVILLSHSCCDCCADRYRIQSESFPAIAGFLEELLTRLSRYYANEVRYHPLPFHLFSPNFYLLIELAFLSELYTTVY